MSYARAGPPSKAGAASEVDAKVRLAQEVVLPPRSRGCVPDRRYSQGMGSSPSAIKCMSAIACMWQLAPWTAPPT